MPQTPSNMLSKGWFPCCVPGPLCTSSGSATRLKCLKSRASSSVHLKNTVRFWQYAYNAQWLRRNMITSQNATPSPNTNRETPARMDAWRTLQVPATLEHTSARLGLRSERHYPSVPPARTQLGTCAGGLRLVPVTRNRRQRKNVCLSSTPSPRSRSFDHTLSHGNNGKTP